VGGRDASLPDYILGLEDSGPLQEPLGGNPFVSLLIPHCYSVAGVGRVLHVVAYIANFRVVAYANHTP
jgi:hypothetical protein